MSHGQEGVGLLKPELDKVFYFLGTIHNRKLLNVSTVFYTSAFSLLLTCWNYSKQEHICDKSGSKTDIAPLNPLNLSHMCFS